MSTGPGADSAPVHKPTTTRGGGGSRKGTFSSLSIRNYRLFFTGAIVSNTGTWMARITQDWLVLSLTGSAAAVGVTTALQFLPMLLFGLYGGVIADRYPKRRLLLVSQAGGGAGGPPPPPPAPPPAPPRQGRQKQNHNPRR
ncbi:MFS transporter, partial [Streptomyces roseolus]|uniref:MFS transporter n=1 Tax=Streptomyces roseolus TaxID=67358 RepID=UPI0036468ED5